MRFPFCNDLEINSLRSLEVVYVPKTDSSSTLCEGVSGGFMFFSSSVFSKIADMKFVLKQNMKKDELEGGRKSNSRPP